MATQQLNIRISEEEALHLESLASQTDGILTKQAVARLLIQHAIATGWSPLDRQGDSLIMGEPAARRASKEVSTTNVVSTSSKKKNKSQEINQCLEQHADLIREFWTLKAGSRGETAWKLLMAELGKLQAKYGDAVVREQLQLAINGKWQGLSLSRYEQFKTPRGHTPAQPEHKHPAARVFQGGRFVDEDGPATNQILKEIL
jgi:hypothetical protein